MKAKLRIVWRAGVAAVLFLPLMAGCSSTKGIKTLADMGKDADYHDQMVRSETQRLENVRSAIEQGELWTGMTAAELVDQCGEPVIAMEEGRETVYVYKDGESTWFTPKKIYVHFDESMRLTSWKCDSSLCSN